MEQLDNFFAHNIYRIVVALEIDALIVSVHIGWRKRNFQIKKAIKISARIERVSVVI